MPEDEKKNYCESGNGGVSVCTAAEKWAECAFKKDHSFLLQCGHQRKLDGTVHCSSEDAQEDARK
jgi:hypothetical protein